MSAPPPLGLTKAAQFGEDLVVRVAREVVSDPEARLFDPDVTLGGVPLEAVGPKCPGTIELRSVIAPLQPLGGKLRLEVLVQNHGAWRSTTLSDCAGGYHNHDGHLVCRST
ncbi:MAG: hypothetical protein P8R42_28995 [Candidatus Binatia bacterium]|nr:hypothetical protein [Candidatus Binatia bacterium]